MTPEDRELLRHSIQLGEQNNAILRGIQRSMRFARVMTIIYWLFIIGTAFGAYYFVQPYIDQLGDAYGGAKSSLSNFDKMMQAFKEARP